LYCYWHNYQHSSGCIIGALASQFRYAQLTFAFANAHAHASVID
jgi:hypothetical protein